MSLEWQAALRGASCSERRARDLLAFARLARRRRIIPSAEESESSRSCCAPREDCAQRIATLSGGELRRVGLALELAHAPALVLADEPTTGLDSFAALTVARSLRALADGRALLGTSESPRAVVATVHQSPRARRIRKGRGTGSNWRDRRGCETLSRVCEALSLSLSLSSLCVCAISRACAGAVK